MRLDKAFLKLEKELDAIERLGENKIIYNNIDSLTESNRLISEFYRKYGNEDGQISLEEFRKYKRGVKLQRKLAEALYVATREDKKVTRGILKDVFKRSYSGTIEVMRNAVDEKTIKAIKKDYSSTSSVYKDIKGLNWIERQNRNRAKVVKDINTTVIKGMEQGKTYHEVANKLVDVYDVKMNDAVKIARTEGHRVRSDAKEAVLEELAAAGTKANKKWISMGDERVRADHKDMDGQVVAIDDNFISPSGAEGPSPGNLGSPEDDINCRCLMVITFEEVNI